MPAMRDPHDALLEQIERIAQRHLREAEYHRRWAVEWHAFAERLDARERAPDWKSPPDARAEQPARRP